MQDDTKKPDDIELDYDDPALDDLEDDDYFDEDDDGADEKPLKTAGAGVTTSALPRKNKNFVQKNFNLIVIAITLVIGAIVILPMLGSKKPVEQAALPEEIAKNPAPPEEKTSAPDMPPIPTPVESAATETTPQPEQPPAQTAEAALTPMPEETVQAPVPAIPVKEDSTAQGTTDIPAPLTEASQEPAKILENSEPAPLLKETNPEEALLAPSPTPTTSETPAPAPEENITVPPVTVPAIETKDIEQAILAEQPHAPAKTEEKQPEPVKQKDTVPAAPIKTPELSKTDLTEISKPEETLAQNVDPTPEPKPVEKTEPKPKAPEKKKSSVSAKKTAYPVQWVLRSAQTGKAVIAPRDSNDLQNISVGETVKGLGRITAIKQENGLWVVHATNGRVSQ